MENKKYLKLLQDYDKHCQRIALATSVNIHENAKQKSERVRKLECDYIAWFEYYFPNYAKKNQRGFTLKWGV